MRFSSFDVLRLNRLQCIIKSKMNARVDIYKFGLICEMFKNNNIANIPNVQRLIKLHKFLEKSNFIHSSYKMHKGYHSNYSRGIRAEKIIKNIYEKHGWTVYQSIGSRGAGDLYCTKKSTRHYVQCKSSLTSNNPSISHLELKHLKESAKKKNAVPIVAKINKSRKISIRYANSGIELFDIGSK